MHLFNKIFRALIESSPLSQKDLAERLDLSESAIVNYKRDRVPKAEELLRIGEFFKISVDQLLRGKAWVELKADLAEHDRVATRAAESGDPQRIGDLIFNLRGEADGLRRKNAQAAADLRQEAERLLDIANKLDPPSEQAQTQSQSQARKGVNYQKEKP